jgi:DNA-binding MarR family transcriptional regulator
MRELVLERGERRPEVVEAIGMSFIRAKVLRALLPGPLTQRDIATRLMMDKPYTSIVVTELEEKGFVTREAVADDRRVRLVTLTRSGKALARKANTILERPPAWLSALDDSDLKELNRMLGQGLLRDPSQRL